MRDINGSTAEHDIIIVGISDYQDSPHTSNKKAYNLKLTKNPQNKYSSRIGFNMSSISEGEYTIVIEFFPPSMTNVSVNMVSTSLNIARQSTKEFPSYTRSIIHMHKWSVVPPVSIDIDLKCDGSIAVKRGTRSCTLNNLCY